ncbi:MAG TPA: hypothetical protein DCL54_18205 [Alphaproteobacteria bacterium]|nr:hypothetical protein [Alphaproteobacteria bacterium]HAJ48514.1 hypothetical protein [Alphaproteobacteria bacterium]
MPDTFSSHGAGLESPAFDAVSIVPHDTNDLAFTARGLYVGGDGDVVALLKGDTVAVTFKNVLAGSILPVSAKRVLATGTTATHLVALW